MTYTYTFQDGRRIEGDTVLGLLEQGVPRKLSVEGLWSYMLSGAVQEPFTLIDGVTSIAEPPPSFSLNSITSDIQPRVTSAIESAVNHSCLIKTPQTTQTTQTPQTPQTTQTTQTPQTTSLPSSFLSGGIDSSAIVAVMRRLYPEEAIRTYCVIHEDPRTDERKWARMVAEANHTKHTEFMLTDEMIKRDIAAALDCYDQPSIDGINNYFASKFVAEVGEKVILSGEGGDELFAGYGQYAKPRQAYRLAKKFRSLDVLKLGRAAGRAITRMASSEKWKKLGQLLSADYDPYFVTRRQYDPDWISKLLPAIHDLRPSTFDSDSQEECQSRKSKVESPSCDSSGILSLFRIIQSHCGTLGLDFGTDIINRCSWMELRHNLRSMYFRDGIQTSAPFGLDIRAPLMDPELVSLVMSIPGSAKCDPKISKPLLVAAAGSGMPEECIFRKKQGFALPFDKYCREGLKDQLEHFVFKGGTGLFNQKEIERIWRMYLAGKISWMRIWQPFVLDWWIKRNKVTF